MAELSPEAQEYIRQQVDSIAKQQTFRALSADLGGSASAQLQSVKKPKVDLTFLAAIAVFLAALGGVYFMMKAKTAQAGPQLLQNYQLPQPLSQTQQYQSLPVSPYQSSPYSQVAPQQPQSQYYDYRYIEPLIDQKLAETKNRISSLERKTWILGLAQNENAVVGQKVAEATGKYDLASKYVFLDKDWHMNKLPEFQEISEEDRRYLLQFYNPTYKQYNVKEKVAPRPEVKSQTVLCPPVYQQAPVYYYQQTGTRVCR